MADSVRKFRFVGLSPAAKGRFEAAFRLEPPRDAQGAVGSFSLSVPVELEANESLASVEAKATPLAVTMLQECLAELAAADPNDKVREAN
jgi:hypothetical protein